MALKAVHVSDVPNLYHVQENAATSVLYADRLSKGLDALRVSFKTPKFTVIGHRGSGMNMLQSTDRRMKSIKENTIRSFNAAANFPVDFVEFDVQLRCLWPRRKS
ncbi:Glycerophosphodiester phosphodiesterase [Thalictrum thalictroides]|uniref:glycerophosphodiester phosphodiesterase n=1 Tax=Thalictrum thalictroides TaxID=46969 RepID=A0A7J6USN5_THATH|nr:Glycerophosphodiester phosphodiesterase [Thalictrum thalictroides]